ncbi:MAG: hypothetical protein JRN21_04805 [Nitrososphaerota archaeon]|nr:hypothetical protein [Nitrososphaerota archaeon]
MNAEPALLWHAEELGMEKKGSTTKENFGSRMRSQKASFLLRHTGVEPFRSFHFDVYPRDLGGARWTPCASLMP